MNNLDFYSWYVQVNILFAVFWLVWFLVNSIFQNLNLKPRPNLRLTISRILFTSILIGPLLAWLVPDFGSQKITVGILDQPIAWKEVFISNLGTTRNLEIANNVIKSKGNLTDLIIFLLFFGLLIRIFWSLKSTVKLALIFSQGSSPSCRHQDK
ncbi:MAG: hypothetical protein ABIK68_17435 [bacterium]